MKTGQPLGLNELMIVNPNPSDPSLVFFSNGGVLHQVPNSDRINLLSDLGTLFLGDDGTLYQAQGLSYEDEKHQLGQLFLGDDGVLYELEGFW